MSSFAREESSESSRRSAAESPLSIAAFTSILTSFGARLMNLISLKRLSQCRSRFVNHSNHRASAIYSLGRTLIPYGSDRIDRDIVPDNASAIMFTHRLRNYPSVVPELCSARNRNPRQSRCEGDDQSVNNTGSQTTKVRTCLPARSAKM